MCNVVRVALVFDRAIMSTKLLNAREEQRDIFTVSNRGVIMNGNEFEVKTENDSEKTSSLSFGNLIFALSPP